MIIICPACSTQFMLSATAMGEAGRNVRCAKCKHQWHAMPQNHAVQPSQEAEQEQYYPKETSHEAAQDDFEEAVTQGDEFDIEQAEAITASLANYGQKNEPPMGLHPAWKVSAAILLLACALTLGLVMRESLAPSLAAVYRMVGYTPEEGIALADVSLRTLRTPAGENPRFEILCQIVNQTQESRPIPQLAMHILNKDGVMLAEDGNFLSNSGDELKPGQSIPCKGLRFSNPFTTATHLVMDLGSPLTLSLQGDWENNEENADE